MVRAFKICVVGSALLIASGLCSPAGNIIVRDDFESGAWSPYWRLEAPYEYSVGISENPAGSGYSLRFEWRKDKWDGTRKNMGVELKTPTFPKKPPLVLRFRFFIDSILLPCSAKPVIIMQYHSFPDLAMGEHWRNPISSLIYQDCSLVYKYKSSKEVVTQGTKGNWIYDTDSQIALGRPPENGWNEMVISQVFDFERRSGSIHILLNNKSFVVENINLGFNDERGPFLKFGLYAPFSSEHERLVIFFDDVVLSYGNIEGEN